jgi:hypothetical protein
MVYGGLNPDSNSEWTFEYQLQNIENFYVSNSLVDDKEGYFRIDPSDLTREEMINLGFSIEGYYLDDEVMLIPFWLYPFLKYEINIIDTNGHRCVIKKEDISSDHRWGYLAYHVTPKTK